MSTGGRKLDEFESMFRSALSEVFHLREPDIKRVVLVSDDDGIATEALLARVVSMLRPLPLLQRATYHALPRKAWAIGASPPIPTLLSQLRDLEPDLLVGPRILLGRTRDLPHTLGSVLDTLSQSQPAPILVLPAPEPTAVDERNLDRVLAVTNHLTGDDTLVSWAASFTRSKGRLYLAHIEDDVTLARYLDVVSKIREIDSDDARAKLPAKLLELPRQYIASIAEALQSSGHHEIVEPIVQMGHALTDYTKLVDEHDIGLIVLNGRDDRQRAMHGLAHALAVELHERPVLLL